MPAITIVLPENRMPVKDRNLYIDVVKKQDSSRWWYPLSKPNYSSSFCSSDVGANQGCLSTNWCSRQRKSVSPRSWRNENRGTSNQTYKEFWLGQLITQYYQHNNYKISCCHLEIYVFVKSALVDKCFSSSSCRQCSSSNCCCFIARVVNFLLDFKVKFSVNEPLKRAVKFIWSSCAAVSSWQIWSVAWIDCAPPKWDCNALNLRTVRLEIYFSCYFLNKSGFNGVDSVMTNGC